MGAQLGDRVEIALKFLLAQQRVDLRMARPANADDFLHHRAIELAFVALVVVAGARDQMMSRERFFATADRAAAGHT